MKPGIKHNHKATATAATITITLSTEDNLDTREYKAESLTTRNLTQFVPCNVNTHNDNTPQTKPSGFNNANSFQRNQVSE